MQNLNTVRIGKMIKKKELIFYHTYVIVRRNKRSVSYNNPLTQCHHSQTFFEKKKKKRTKCQRPYIVFSS